MSRPVIHVENLGKLYQIGERESYSALRDVLAKTISAPFRFFSNGKKSPEKQAKKWLWALKDVSFDVQEGEVVGLIGRNGAGKSTLLKVLARITKPTTGFARIHGKIGSLLEVGTGFHAELTGHENIYLSGAILGMRKKEIDRKFDEIVAFSELEQFMDTPVKYYSSGMYIRLAFGVAAHLEPEILLVDEVLAVGDAAFQRKCLGKMGDVAKRGRTVLFVSHDMRAISDLCRRCLWIEDGKIAADGAADRVVHRYLDSTAKEAKNFDGVITEDMHENGGHIYLRRVSMLDDENRPTGAILFRDPLRFRLEFDICKPVEGLGWAIYVEKLDGMLVSTLSDSEVKQGTWDLNPGRYSILVEADLPLSPGSYTLNILAKRVPWRGSDSYVVKRAFVFHIDEVGKNGEGIIFSGGTVRPASKWILEKASASEYALKHDESRSHI